MVDKRFDGKNKGIYGIYIDDELVYIGMTLRNFEQRFNEHKSRMNNPKYKGQPLLYDTLRRAKVTGHHISARPLIDLSDL